MDGNENKTKQGDLRNSGAGTSNRFPLSTKQIGLIRDMRMGQREIEARINGVLQLIYVENDLKGKATLSDDGTELILEEDKPAT